MPMCVLREQLADYEAWRAGFYAHFDANAEQLRKAGVVLEAVYRDADDPNVILTTIRFASREQGEAMLADPAQQADMEANGVDLGTLRVEWYEDPS
jgi:quinol monooxygenase YgiN